MIKKIQHKFIETIPLVIEENTLYISIKYKVCIHLCFCWCKEKVITTLTPDSWYLIYNGKTISIKPSIWSFNLKCWSHYYITNNNIIWIDNFQINYKKKKKKSWINIINFWT